MIENKKRFTPSSSIRTGAIRLGTDAGTSEDQLQFRSKQTQRTKKLKITLPKMPWDEDKEKAQE